MPRSKKRKVTRERQAKQARAAQQKAETKKLTPEQYTRRRALGWTLVALAVTLGVSHWLQHVGAIQLVPDGWADLAAGYPMAALLAIWGTIVLSK